MEKVINKVQKLLRLAEKAGTPEEAGSAFAMASALLAKHGLGLDDLSVENQNQDENFGNVESELIDRSGRVMQWKATLALIIAKEHACQAWFIKKTGVVVLGHQKNRSAVAYLYQSVIRQIDALTKEKAYGKGGRFVNSYRHGCVSAVASKIQNSTEGMIRQEYSQNQGNSMALVRLDHALETRKRLEREVATKMPRLGKGYSSKTVDASGFEAGRRDGQGIAVGGGKGLTSGLKKIG